MRKFYVFYRDYQWGTGEYVYEGCDVILNENEKANRETFCSKIDSGIEVLAWSLVEE